MAHPILECVDAWIGGFPAYIEKISVTTVGINVSADPILAIEVIADRPEDMCPNSRYVVIRGSGHGVL